MKLERKSWGEYQKHPVELFTVSDPKTGFLVQITDFGATLVRVMMPDKDGHLDDINYGQNTAEEFDLNGGYLGANVGRVANRISDAKFTLEGKTYSLFVNNANKHSLHGGKVGFNRKFWSCKQATATSKDATLMFEYISPDGEEGYPGTLITTITYKISPMKLQWEYSATTDKTTIVSLTNHAYWNLDGINTLIDDLEIRVDADKYLPGDDNNLPLGEIKTVSKTSFDLRKPVRFGDIFKKLDGIDNHYYLNQYKKDATKLGFAAELFSPKTGRRMTVSTNQPGVQIYTGNYFMNVKSFGIQQQKHGAVCLETQKAPNCINMPQFGDSIVLKPGEKYIHTTLHEFSVSKIQKEE